MKMKNQSINKLGVINKNNEQYVHAVTFYMQFANIYVVCKNVTA